MFDTDGNRYGLDVEGFVFVHVAHIKGEGDGKDEE